MLRMVLVLLLALMPSFAAAQEDRYVNSRYGYSIDVPARFRALGESANGDGQVFERREKGQKLTVWGGFVIDSFEDEVRSRQRYATDSGWTLTYEATTPSWASFSGTNGGRILYQRLISLCDGASYAAFSLEYFSHDAAVMDAAVNELVRSLRGTGNC
jgi:hypothetical protein